MSKELYTALDNEGLLEYGSVILGSKIRELIGLKVPETARWKVYKEMELVEFNAIQYVRDILLNQGKYIKRGGDNYRILLPSENAQQVENYMSAADRKLNRARKLLKNSPPTEKKVDNVEARLHMKMSGRRTHTH